MLRPFAAGKGGVYMADDRPRPLAGQTAIVTGASSGIGAGIARAFAAAGATVGVNHIGDEAATAAILADIKNAGGRAVALAADVSVEAQVVAMVRDFVAAEK